VDERGVIAFAVAKGFEDRHLNVIAASGVVWAVAAVPDVGAGARKNRLPVRNARQRLKAWRGLGVITLRQAVDLLDVEHRVALHVMNVAVGF